jgi:uncharacterized protein YciI
MKTFFLLFSLILSISLFAQENEKKYDMKTYYFVFLKRGPNKDIDSVKLNEIQAAHIKNIERLADEGKIHIAGPFLDDSDLRGIFIIDAASIEEARELVETDPAIKIGRLSYEIKPWLSAKNSCLK